MPTAAQQETLDTARPEVLVEWPWSQDYMDEEWFEEEAELENGHLHGSGQISGSSYWIPPHRLYDRHKTQTAVFHDEEGSDTFIALRY